MLDDIKPGSIIEAPFLWSHEKGKGREEGAKNRRCIVMARMGDKALLVHPITSKMPTNAAYSMTLPERDKRGGSRLSDHIESRVACDELNIIELPSSSLLPTRSPGQGTRWALGQVSGPTFDRLRKLSVAAAQDKVQKVSTLKRDPALVRDRSAETAPAVRPAAGSTDHREDRARKVLKLAAHKAARDHPRVDYRDITRTPLQSRAGSAR